MLGQCKLVVELCILVVGQCKLVVELCILVVGQCKQEVVEVEGWL